MRVGESLFHHSEGVGNCLESEVATAREANTPKPPREDRRRRFRDSLKERTLKRGDRRRQDESTYMKEEFW